MGIESPLGIRRGDMLNDQQNDCVVLGENTASLLLVLASDAAAVAAWLGGTIY